jgi:hypothetical protein
MNTITAIVTKQKYLSHYHTANSLTERDFKVLDDKELELDAILAKELQQQLPSDILANV